MIHDFLSHREVETLRNLSETGLSRLKVPDKNKTGLDEGVDRRDFRLADGKNLMEKFPNHQAVLKINRRISAITGLVKIQRFQ